jgi:hypothetical protein
MCVVAADNRTPCRGNRPFAGVDSKRVCGNNPVVNSLVQPSVFRHAVHIVATVAVAFHLVGGCCWHHAHADAAEGGPVAQADHCCPCGQHDDAPRPADEGGCENGHCAFIAPQIGGACPSVAAGMLVQPLFVAPIVTAPSLGEPFDSSPSHPLIVGSLRLHLLKQVLLV